MSIKKVLWIMAIVGCSHNPHNKHSSSKKEGSAYSGFMVEEVESKGLSTSSDYAFRIIGVIPEGPADLAGIRVGDTIVSLNGDGFKFTEKQEKIPFKEFMNIFQIGNEIDLEIKRKNEGLKTYHLKLVKRAYGPGPKILVDDQGLRVGKQKPELLEKLSSELIDSYLLSEEYNDLRRRLSDLTVTGDMFRRNLVAFVQRNPFQIKNVAQEIVESLQVPTLKSILRGAAKTLDMGEIAIESSIHKLNTVDQHLKFIEEKIGKAVELQKRALEKLTEEELKFLQLRSYDLISYFASNISINMDENYDRWKENIKTIKILSKVDLKPYLLSALELTYFLDDKFYLSLRKSLIKEKIDLTKNIIKTLSTSIGEIIIGGTGSNTYQNQEESKLAVIIDLGGNDNYLGNFASGGIARPVSVLVDLAGDDHYESWGKNSFGSGYFGVGILVDQLGNDSYLGTDLNLGFGFAGVGILQDSSGDDVYRSKSYAQGASFFGLGVLMDRNGNDQFDSKYMSQGLAIAGGLGLLVDSGGNDQYFAKGLLPSSYGDPGIFQSYSQGVGLGLRDIASGGIGILLDQNGNDSFDGGEFSQGAGYYFGWGILSNQGNGNDQYLGARYCQSAATHYALGTFLEEGGDDTYDTRNFVSLGIAWDLGVAWFEDYSGNDRYSLKGLSQGASAHNSISVFRDHSGIDDHGKLSTYLPAVAKDVDAHGGINWSLNIDEGGADDSYRVDLNNQIIVRKEYGYFMDLKNDLKSTISNPTWKKNLPKILEKK